MLPAISTSSEPSQFRRSTDRPTLRPASASAARHRTIFTGSVSFPAGYAPSLTALPAACKDDNLVISKKNPLVIKPSADYSHFDALDIRVGRIIKVEDAATRKPTYRLTIDFGPEIAVRASCGAYRNYAPGELLGKQIIGIVNFAEKKMGPEVSQVLVLGVPNEKGETIYLMPQTDVCQGRRCFK